MGQCSGGCCKPAGQELVVFPRARNTPAPDGADGASAERSAARAAREEPLAGPGDFPVEPPCAAEGQRVSTAPASSQGADSEVSPAGEPARSASGVLDLVPGDPVPARLPDGVARCPAGPGAARHPAELPPAPEIAPEVTEAAGLGAGGAAVDAPPKPRACEIIARATQRMENFELLDAEGILARSIHDFTADGDLDAVHEVTQSAVYQRVAKRIAEYEEVRTTLRDHSSFSLLWSKPSGQLWLHKPPGSSSWFEYKLSLNIEATLTECMAVSSEMDLVTKAQPVVTKSHNLFFHPLCLILLNSIDVPVFNIELLFEVFRVVNTEFGYLTETITSNFHQGGLAVPKKDWRTIRPSMQTSNIWMPRGGGQEGTVLVQVTRVDFPIKIPAWALKMTFETLAPKITQDLQESSMKARDPQSPWQPRIKADATGFYRDLAAVVAVADQRQVVSAQQLPGEDVFSRDWTLHPRGP